MIKIACVGCGGIMQEHYKWLSQMEDVKFVGHCDIEKDRAGSGAARFGGQAFTEFEAMYEKVKPHAVYIAVPPHAHGPMEQAAAARGIHLFIEKPIARCLDTAVAINEAIRNAKTICSVGYCFRYNDTMETARQILKGKAVSLVSGGWTGGMPSVHWWRQMDKSGGQILEQTTHLFDLMRYLCGEIAEVYANAATGCMTNVPDFNVHDSSTTAMRLKSGASAVITSSCVCHHGAGVKLNIITPEATLAIAGGNLTVREPGKTTEYTPSVNMYQEEDRIFIEAIRSGKRNRIKSTYADALKTFRATLAANESIVSGMPIEP